MSSESKQSRRAHRTGRSQSSILRDLLEDRLITFRLIPIHKSARSDNLTPASKLPNNSCLARSFFFGEAVHSILLTPSRQSALNFTFCSEHRVAILHSPTYPLPHNAISSSAVYGQICSNAIAIYCLPRLATATVISFLGIAALCSVRGKLINFRGVAVRRSVARDIGWIIYGSALGSIAWIARAHTAQIAFGM